MLSIFTKEIHILFPCEICRLQNDIDLTWIRKDMIEEKELKGKDDEGAEEIDKRLGVTESLVILR